MTCSLNNNMASPSSSQVVLPTVATTNDGLNKPTSAADTTAVASSAATATSSFQAGVAPASEAGSTTSSASGRRKRIKKKKYRYACKFNASCDKIAKAGGMCIAHGGGKRCSLPGCVKVARYSGSLCHVHRTAEVDQLRGQAAANINNMSNNMNGFNMNNSLNMNMASNHAQFAASMAAAVQQQQQQVQHLPASPLFRHQQHLQHELQQQLLRVNTSQAHMNNNNTTPGGSQGPSRTPTPLLPPGYNNTLTAGQPQPTSADLLLAMYGLSGTVGSSSSSPVASSAPSPTTLMGSIGCGGMSFPNTNANSFGGVAAAVAASNPYYSSDSSGLVGGNNNAGQQHLPMSTMMPLSSMMSSSVNGMLGSGGSSGGMPNNWVTNSLFTPRQPQQYYQLQQPASNNGSVGNSRRSSDASQEVAPKRVRVESPSVGLSMPAAASSSNYNPQSTMAQLHSIMSSVATTSTGFPVSAYTASTSSGFSAPFMP